MALHRDPFGALTVTPLGAPSALHAALAALPLPAFPGQWHDPWTGLVHNGHRLYDPTTAAYINPDPIGQLGGLHVYRYAGGDPVGLVDPTGLITGAGGTSDAAALRGMGSVADSLPPEAADALLTGALIAASVLPGLGDVMDVVDCVAGSALACASVLVPGGQSGARKLAEELWDTVHDVDNAIDGVQAADRIEGGARCGISGGGVGAGGPRAADAGVRAADRVEDGIEKGRSLTDRQAIERLRRGQDVHSASKAKAKQLQKKASHGKPVHDKAHGEGYFDHFHGKDRQGGHAFHGEPK
ncbi:MAG: RHS repeat-associated core domain-containing protein [Gemmatimonadetes bacterium]|nr:RHS repeat-associated core domain-containing protein [Gemmatimonadota bacterium]